MRTLNLENAVGSRKSTQALNAPSKFKNLLITNKVATQFLNSLCTSISCMSFPRPTTFPRLRQQIVLACALIAGSISVQAELSLQLAEQLAQELDPVLQASQAKADAFRESEVMRRIAAPMVGGMISATLLTLVVIPAVLLVWKKCSLH